MIVDAHNDAPQRRCCGCRTPLSANDGLRWVVAPDGALAFDLRRRAPGRGANTCATARCVGQAVKKGAFGRTLKAEVRVADATELVTTASAALDRQVHELLGLIRRSGDLVIGAKDVKQGLRARDFSLVVVSTDHSERSAADFSAVSVRWGTSESIGRAIGRKPTGVVAAPAGALTDQLVSAVRKSNSLAGTSPVEKKVLS